MKTQYMSSMLFSNGHRKQNWREKETHSLGEVSGGTVLTGFVTGKMVGSCSPGWQPLATHGYLTKSREGLNWVSLSC